MIDSQNEKYRIIFSIINQPQFGWMVECYAVKEGGVWESYADKSESS